MTKLEQKLLELGYEYINNSRWVKDYDGNKNIFINTNENHNKIKDYYIHFYSFVECQQDINDLQQAFNQLQNDLKELKQVENE